MCNELQRMFKATLVRGKNFSRKLMHIEIKYKTELRPIQGQK